MSKFDIGVGEAFPLDESQAGDDPCGHHGRHHRHHHHHDHEGHRHGRDHHGHHHHHANMAALAALFARAYRGRVRNPAEPE
jgi:hypothetical protein